MTHAKDYRTQRGALLTLNNAKTPKGEAHNVLTAIMYLAPHKLSGWNVCPKSTPDCRRDCLYSSGRGRFSRTQEARLRRTRLYFEHRAQFMRQLTAELFAIEAYAISLGMRLAVRLNGTSDILWERYESLFAAFHNVSFYDYTKHTPHKRAALPLNYKLTFSVQRETMKDASDALAAGWNVAAVCSKADHAVLIAQGKPFLDATSHDARHLDPPVSICLLTPKGSLAKHTARSSGMILSYVELRALGAGQ